jgi:hypothetical protein
MKRLKEWWQKIIREWKYRRRIKALKKKDPFTYK